MITFSYTSFTLTLMNAFESTWAGFWCTAAKWTKTKSEQVQPLVWMGGCATCAWQGKKRLTTIVKRRDNLWRERLVWPFEVDDDGIKFIVFAVFTAFFFSVFLLASNTYITQVICLGSNRMQWASKTHYKNNKNNIKKLNNKNKEKKRDL